MRAFAQLVPGALTQLRGERRFPAQSPASPAEGRWLGLADLSPLPFQLSGGCELTVVIHDFTACNSTELTIRRGQTVEVLERPHDKPDWCLVRTTDRSPAAEGLVPCGSLCIAHSRSSMEMEGIFNHKGRSWRSVDGSAGSPGVTLVFPSPTFAEL